MEISGAVLFCDDVRREIGGKMSLIGCYGVDMHLVSEEPHPFPLLLPKLGILVVALLPADKPPPIKLLISFPVAGEGDARSSSVDLAEPKYSIDDGRLLLRHSHIISPVPIEAEGYIRVQLLYGDQSIRLGALKIIHTPAPTMG